MREMRIIRGAKRRANAVGHYESQLMVEGDFLGTTTFGSDAEWLSYRWWEEESSGGRGFR
jgi:hypothetical protein